MLTLINKMGNTYIIQDTERLNNLFYTKSDCILALDRGIKINGLSLDAIGNLSSTTHNPVLPPCFKGQSKAVLILGEQILTRGFDLSRVSIDSSVVNKGTNTESSIISEISHSTQNIRTLEFSEGFHCSKLLRVPLTVKQEVKIFDDLNTKLSKSSIVITSISLSPNGIIVKCYFVYFGKDLANIVLFRA